MGGWEYTTACLPPRLLNGEQHAARLTITAALKWVSAAASRNSAAATRTPTVETALGSASIPAPMAVAARFATAPEVEQVPWGGLD
jgi:hypothetical protein